MNRIAVLSLGTLMGALTLMAIDPALGAAPEPARSAQADTTYGPGIYRGFRPAVPGMVHALQAGEACHESGHCSDWVASVIEASDAAASEDKNSWRTQMSERILETLQPIAKNLEARIERVACSQHACFAEATYAKAGRTEDQIVSVDTQLLNAVSGSSWAQSEFRVKPSLDGFGGMLYEGPPSNPTVDTIWVWPRK